MTRITTRTRVAATALLLTIALGGCAGEEGAEAGAGAAPDTMAAPADTSTATQPVTVGADAGLQTPESVLYDEQADVYLVSNINGTPVEKDGNGFVARVRPDGTVDSLRWIAGGRDGATLNAPKGLALKGDTLFISDIDEVRAFDRTTGRPYGSRAVPGATFLNDLVVAADGGLYVTDSGLNPDFSSSGTDAIYRFEGDRAVPVAEGARLHSPNGIAVDGESLIVAPFASTEVLRVSLAGDSISSVATLPAGQLDGVVRMPDGSLLVSSWEASTVFRVPAGGGTAEVVVEGVPSPADIGWDGRRQRLLIPVFTENRLVFHPLTRSP